MSQAPPVMTIIVPQWGKEEPGQREDIGPESSSQFPRILLYLHLDSHQTSSSQNVSEKKKKVCNEERPKRSRAGTGSTKPGSKSLQGSGFPPGEKQNSPGGPRNCPGTPPSHPYSNRALEAWERAGLRVLAIRGMY